MSSLDREMSGDVLVFHLEAERAATADPAVLERSGRNARTLVKQGGLRVTLVTVSAGGSITEHRAAGPISVHVLSGEILFQAGEATHRLEAGTLLTLAGGQDHSVTSENGGSFLLTVCQPTPEA